MSKIIKIFLQAVFFIKKVFGSADVNAINIQKKYFKLKLNFWDLFFLDYL